MPVQTAYNERIALGFVGQVADTAQCVIRSHIAEDATTAFGLAVIQGTADDEAKVGAAGTFLGLTVRDVALPPDNGDVYKAGDNMAVLTKGAMFVTAGAAVSAGDAVYRTATGVLTNVSTGNTVIDDARWSTSAASGAVAIIILE